MTETTVFADLPSSTQNPLLGPSAFFKYCSRRFRSVRFQKDFDELLSSYVRDGLLIPAWIGDGRPFYSSFQAWVLHWLEGPHHGWDISRFNVVLRLLVAIQDIYLPECRSDKRWGQVRDYDGLAGIDGTYWVKTQAVLLSSLRRQRAEYIRKGAYDPGRVLRDSSLDWKSVTNWAQRFDADGKFIDPMEDWRRLVSFVSYDKREALKFEALQAHSFYEMGELLRMFQGDLVASASGFESFPNPRTTEESWEDKTYGVSAKNPFRLLEFVINEHELNPKPRGIVLTEGEEHEAVRAVFDFYEFDPNLLGIEFRSIGGIGRFSVTVWQQFVEYMHEKQVLVYFVIDREGVAATEARKMLSKKRMFTVHGLKRIVPRADRIKLWRSSFEEANFTDREIADAFQEQGYRLSSRDVKLVRKDQSRERGLVKEICVRNAWKIDKKTLASVLVDRLLARRKESIPKRLRPIERFVLKAGRLIVRNYQPINPDHQRANFNSGLLG